MVKKIITGAIDALCTVLILLSLAVLLTVVTTKNGKAPMFFGYTAFRVLTGSMEPTIPVDSMLVVKSASASEVEEGDIISFYTETPEIYGSVVTHRAIRVTEEDGTTYITTKGDANSIEDGYPVTDRNLIGKVVAKSVILGKIVGLSSNPVIFALFIFLPMLLILITNVLTTVKTAKQIEKEEIEKALNGKNNQNE